MAIENPAAYSEAQKRIELCLKERQTILHLRGLGLTALPPEIGQLTHLNKLHLMNNKLTSLPKEIGFLTALTTLWINGNKFTMLPREIANLPGLTSLWLDNNRITTLSIEPGTFSALSFLSLSKSKLKALPPGIGMLRNLKELFLAMNSLSTLPSEIGGLTSLRRLNLVSNAITSLPQDITRLSSLNMLDLSDNSLMDLPSLTFELTTLSALYLGNNKLKTLPPDIGRLSNLRVLHLNNNQLARLPIEILRLKQLVFLSLHENPKLGLPAEILGPKKAEFSASNPPATPQDILYYFFLQRSGLRRPLNEVKVLVVGESEVGKTSLIRQLRGESHNPRQDKTHGIERYQMLMECGRLGEVRLNVWDFGGQDIMHATHQFFLTHRSVYLLVLDSRQNERQSRIDYWLRLIASYGGDSPVIVVCNKSDQQVMQLNWTGLQRDYPQIKAFTKEVSCYHCDRVDRRKGLDELKKQIAHTVETDVAEVDRPVLTSWLDFKDQLEKDARPYLTLAEYHTEGQNNGIKEHRDREILLTLMHELGSVLHFSEHAIFAQQRERNATPSQVEELNVLDPGWVTGAIYKLLNDAELIRTGGVMDRGRMRRSLAELPGAQYPASKEDFIIAMMRRFEICFAFDGDEDRWFLPDLLHKDEVDTGDWSAALQFRYEYRVLPGSVIGRLLVRLHGHVAKHCLWRTGAKLKHGVCEALVRSQSEETPPRLEIFIRGGNLRGRKEFLTLIRGTLRDIHGSFSDNLGVRQLVPVPGLPEVFVDHERLLLKEGKEPTATDDVNVEGDLVEFKVADALNAVTDRNTRDQERIVVAQKSHEKRQERVSSTTINVNILGDFINEGGKSMNDDNSVNVGRDNYGQVGQMLANCNNMICVQTPGERKNLLDAVNGDAQKLIETLPADKKNEAAENLGTSRFPVGGV